MLRLILTFLFFQAQLFASEPIPETKDILAITKPNSNDLKIARLIYTIIGDLKKGKIRKVKLTQLKHLSHKSEYYKNLVSFSDAVLETKSHSKDNLLFLRTCHQVNFQTYIEIQNELESAFRSYCSVNTLNFLVKDKKIHNNEEVFDLFYDSLDMLLTKRNISKLIYSLKRIKKKDLKEKIQIQIEQYLLASNNLPNKKIFPYITFTPDLTKHFQKIREQASANYMFERTLRDFRRSITYLLRDNKITEGSEVTKKMQKFYKANQKYIKKESYWKSLISAGRDYSFYSSPKKAIELFDEALSVTKNNDQMSKTYFNMLLTYLRRKDSVNAINLIEKYNLIKDFDKYNSRLKFWVSQSLFHNNQKDLSKYYLRRLAQDSPLTFYSIIAIKKLHQKNELGDNSKFFVLRRPSSEIENLNSELSTNYIYDLNRLRVWNSLGLDKYSFRIIKNLRRLDNDYFYESGKIANELTSKQHHKIFIKHASKIFNNDKRYLQTFKLIHGSLNNQQLDVDALTIKKLFPFEYYNQIKRIDSKIDPIIVLSLIRQESAFDPHATSSVGAKGLMQLMLPTARMYQKRVTRRQLSKPKTNIKIGISYLKRLLRRFNGNLINTLASYNAGENRVKRWTPKLLNNEDPLLNIESIPFLETRKYVKLIYRNIFFYHLLTKDKIEDTPINESFIISMNKS